MKSRTSRNNLILVIAIMVVTTLMATIVTTGKADAANIKKSKPKFVVSKCQFAYSKAELAWKKVKGAKKYQVLRANKKGGKYKVFATTKKTRLAKKSVGEYYYKVRAIDGKKKSKFSSPIHLFAAKGEVLDTFTMTTNIMNMYTISSTFYDLGIINISKKAMKFEPKEGNYYVVAKEKKTGKTEKFEASFSKEESVVISAGKGESFSVRSKAYPGDYPSEDYDLYVKAKFKAGGKNFILSINYSNKKQTTVGAITK